MSYDYHDATIRQIAITMAPGKRWDVKFDLRNMEHEVTIAFVNIWWVGVHGLGMISNEGEIDSIMETSWDEVPAVYRYLEGGYKVFEIKTCSGSRILVAAKELIESFK